MGIDGRTAEGRVKQAVKNILKRHKAWYFMPVPTGYGVRGIGDFVVCFRGFFIMIECKAKDGMKPTPLQQMQMAEVQKAGGTVFLATPETLGGLERWFNRIEEG